MPVQFILGDVIMYEYDDYLRPPVSPERQALLKKAFEDLLRIAQESGIEVMTVKHVKDSPLDDNFVLTSSDKEIIKFIPKQ